MAVGDGEILLPFDGTVRFIVGFSGTVRDGFRGGEYIVGLRSGDHRLQNDGVFILDLEEDLLIVPYTGLFYIEGNHILTDGPGTGHFVVSVVEVVRQYKAAVLAEPDPGMVQIVVFIYSVVERLAGKIPGFFLLRFIASRTGNHEQRGENGNDALQFSRHIHTSCGVSFIQRSFFRMEKPICSALTRP